MKAMICEMCGSNRIIKQEGIYACRDCGTQYSVEEARKLLVERTAKADDSQELPKLFEEARRARDTGNSENACKLYEQILEKDPSGWEANFYPVYYQTVNCAVEEIYSAATRIADNEGSVLELIKTNVKDGKEQAAAIGEIAERLISLSDTLFRAAKDHMSNTVGNGSVQDMRCIAEYVDRGIAATDILYRYGDLVVGMFSDVYASGIAASCWQAALAQHKQLLSKVESGLKEKEKTRYKEYREKIKDCSGVSKQQASRAGESIAGVGNTAYSATAGVTGRSAVENALSAVSGMRKGMKAAMIVCGVMAMLYLLVFITESATGLFATAFFSILSAMFFVIGITPATQKDVRIFGLNVSKKLFVGFCLILAFSMMILSGKYSAQ